jgi:hypothetical protein
MTEAARKTPRVLPDVVAKTPPRAFRETLDTLLLNCEVGARVTWTRAAEVCGHPVASVYVMVNSAKSRLEKQGVHFRVVRRVGLERITDSDVVTSELPKRNGQIAAAAGRGLQTVAALDYTALAPDERCMAAGSAALYQGLAGVKTETRTLIEAGASVDYQQIVADTKKLFSK